MAHTPGRFIYTRDQGQNCSLQIGDYTLDDFVATWTSKDDDWYFDA
ncbi:MAG: hypothetical protein JNJ83_24155 [Verrucomicrobiaceae bacterium]|nr:hypothetical protein [Verrucomicrobiaceae bacterium]